MTAEKVNLKIGMLARIGAFFVLVCVTFASLVTIYFIFFEGPAIFAFCLLIFNAAFGYLLWGITFKGKVPVQFKWLE